MAKFKKIFIKEGSQWSEWEQPYMARYRMGCCDCGLVHDIEFRVVKEPATPTTPIEIDQAEDVGGVVILMRARRNNHSTTRLRKNQHITMKTTTIEPPIVQD